jgi:hypothetical protein
MSPLVDDGVDFSASPPPSLAAEITYLEGKAEASRDGRVRRLDVGDELSPGDAVSTGADSSCEIKLGNSSIMRLDPETTVSLNAMFLGLSRVQVDLTLSRGIVLNRVNKLLNGDSYVLRSPSMVCGVRGTAFLLKAEGNGASLLAVQEGRVKALPASPALNRLASSAQASGLARAVLGGLISLGPEVGPGSELRYGPEERKAAAAFYESLERELSALPSEPMASPSALDGLIPVQEMRTAESANAKKILALLSRGAKAALGSPSPASAATKVLFTGLERVGKGAAEGRPRGTQAPSPDPAILGLIKGSGASAVGGIVQFKGLALVSDAKGVISAYDDSGTLAWRTQTSSAEAQLSYPVVFKDKLYYSGSGGLDVIDGASGKLLVSRALERPDSRLDGLRPYQFPGGILVPRSAGIDIVSPETGERLDSLELPEGLMMSPAAAKGKQIVYVTATGVFRLVDVASKKAIKEIPTGASGLSPQSLRNRDNLYFFADSSGLAVLIDIEADEPLWQKRVSGAITSESEMGKSAIYLPTTEGLYILGIADGQILAVMPGISGPPLLSGDQLFLCSDSGELIVAKADPYTELTRVRLPFVGSCRALIVGKTLWVAGKGGQIVRIDPELLKRRDPKAKS